MLSCRRAGDGSRWLAVWIAVVTLLGSAAVMLPIPEVLGGTTAAVAAPPVGAASGRFVAIPPVLLADQVSIAAGATLTVSVAGRAGVPAGAAGVTLTVSARGTGASGGSLVLYPSDVSRPATVSVSYRAGAWVRTATVTALSDAGAVTVANDGTAAATVSVEIDGYIASTAEESGSVFVPLAPNRVVNGVSVPAGGSVNVTPTGTSVPATGVRAFALSVTATAASTGGLSLYPAGASPPPAPQLELLGRSGVYASGLVTVGPGTSGAITIANSGASTATVYADLAGYYSAAVSAPLGTSVVPVPPARLLTTTSVPAFGSTNVAPLGTGGVPATGVSGVCLTVTAGATGTSSGYLVVYPTGTNRPSTTSVAYLNDQQVSGSDYAKLGSDGTVTIANRSGAAVTITVDATCYLRSAGPPAAPTEVTASSGDGSATVYWRAAASDSPVTEYVVTTEPGGASVSAAGGETLATVTGLDNGTAYRFSVTARSAAGTSPASALTDPVTPGPPPAVGTPFITAVYPRDGAVRVTWTPPTTGASGVTSYRVVASPGGAAVDVAGSVTETVLGGLVNGTTYTFTVTAANATGPGAASPPSEPVTPRPADVPLAPADLLTVALDQRIDVQWVAPADGGAVITGYTVTAEPGAHSVQVAADTTVAKLTELVNGTAYTVRVVAHNSAGDSEPAQSDGVVPAASRPPGAPTDVRVGAVDAGGVAVAWNAPVDVGTSPVTGYTVTANPGGSQVTVAGTSATFTGLDAATAYRFSVVAVNAAGGGPTSTAPAAITPSSVTKKVPYVLSAEELAALQDVRGDSTLLFLQPPSSIPRLASGTVIAVRPTTRLPRGLLRAVTNVANDGGVIVVSTREVGLDEIFSSAGLAAISDIGDSEVAEIVADSPAIRRKQPTLRGRTLADGAPSADGGVDLGLRDGHLVAELTMSVNAEQGEDPLHNADKVPPVGGRLEAELDLAPHLENELHVSAASGVQTRHLARVAFTAELRAKLGVMRHVERELPGLKLRARCFDIQAGPVPIVVCLELNVKPRLEADGSIGITTALSFGRIIGAELATDNGTVTDLHGINDAYTPAQHQVDAYADGSVTLSLPVEATVYFYNTAGPGLIIRPYAQLLFDTTQDPWWELRFGVTLGVFLRSREFFGKKIDFSTEDLVNFFFTAAQADGPFKGLKIAPDHPDVAPNEPVHLSVSVIGYSGDIPVQWRVVAGPGSIDATGTFVSDLAGTAVVEASSPADAVRGELRQRAVVSISGSTRPGPPQRPVATAKPLSAQVSWSRPVTDGRSPILRYAIVTLPNAAVTFVPGSQTTARISGLAPGTPYRFQVYAVNALGTSAPSVATDPVTPVTGVHPTGDVFDVAVDAEGNHDTSGSVGTYGASVSGDGRYVFFGASCDSNLAPEEVHGCGNAPYLLRKDRVTGEIILASRRADGHTPATITGYDEAYDASYDGSLVLFTTEYTDPVTIEVVRQLLVYDIKAGTTRVLSDTPLYNLSKVALLDDGAGAVVRGSTTDTSFSEKLYVVTGAGSLLAVPCPDAGCGYFPWGNFDVDATGKTIVYPWRRNSSSSSHLMRYDVASGATTDLTPLSGGTTDENTDAEVISRDGAFIAADYRYFNGFLTQPITRGIIRAPADTGRVSSSDIVQPIDVDAPWTKPFGISEDGRVIGYWVDGPSGDINSTSIHLYDTYENVTLPVEARPGHFIQFPRIADNPVIVIWTEDLRDDGGTFRHHTGIWARALG